MKKNTYILHLEDDDKDAELIQAMLDAVDVTCQIARVQSGNEFREALQRENFDLILADYRLPGYDGLSALRLAQELCADIPFIFVSGIMGEDAAIDGLTQGATDYVLKHKLARLVPAVKRALEDAENKRERRHAEEALRKSNVLLERIFAVTEFMVAYLDANFNFIRVNRAYAVAFEGREPGFFEGKNYFALYSNVENEAIFRKVVETGEPYTTHAKPFRYTDHPERGTTYWNWSLHAVKDENGSVSGLVLSLIDVTEREQAYLVLRQRDEQLHLQGTALEAAANGFVITDQAGKIIWVNPAFTRLTGYSSAEAVGQKPSIMKSGKQDQDFYKNLWNTILSEKTWHGELVNRHKDGHHYVEEMTITPLRGEDGIISHFIAIKQDISERKQHELEHEAIITVTTALRTAATRAEILAVTLDQLNDLFGADGAMFATLEVASGEVVIEMGRGYVGERFMGLHIPPGKGVSGWIIANKKSYLNNDAPADMLFYRPDLLGDSRAVASVPLITQGHVVGALWIVCKNEIKENDVRLLNAIGDIAANAIRRVTLYEQTERQLQHLIALHQIDITISTSLDLNISLNVLLNNVITQLSVDAASILLLTPHTQTLEYAAGIGFRTRKIEQTQVRLGEGQAGIAALQRRIVSLPDLNQTQDVFSRTILLTDERFISHYVAPLIAKGQIKGVLEVFTRRRLDPSQEWLDFFETLATQAAIAIDSATLFDNLQRSNTELKLAYEATIEGWSRALDLRDKETEGHTQRVTEMTLRLATQMGMNDMEKLELRRGALLHDIGKMGIPDTILLKPGKLTDGEWEVMRQHPTYAYEMLAPISYLKQALEIPYCHHEKWDGSGYPRGLKGEQIPLAARIFSVVDVFDALVSDRPYRQAWSKTDAYQYIREQGGKHFDPGVVSMFLEMQQ